jgi:hypothetical protein
VLHTLGIQYRVSILTASTCDRRILGDNDLILIPPELANDLTACRIWLHETIERLAPDTLYIDTFPAGILGEFCDFEFPSALRLHHIARLLRWENYRTVITGMAPRFDRSYIVEPLLPEHERFLRKHSEQMIEIDLCYPSDEMDVRELLKQLTADGRPLWLVVHSGPEEEIMELIAYAGELAVMEKCEPSIVLVAPSTPADLPAAIRHLDLYPATPLFPFADRIITACGFNAMRQTEPWRVKHRFMPFARRYDDQFMRAARGRITASP